MIATAIAAVLAEGRGDDPGTAVGILIIAGIAVALLALGLLGHWLVHRFGRTRTESLDHRPHREGDVGRAGKRRGP